MYGLMVLSYQDVPASPSGPQPRPARRQMKPDWCFIPDHTVRSTCVVVCPLADGLACMFDAEEESLMQQLI